MIDKNAKNVYDDDNIPEVDLPKKNSSNGTNTSNKSPDITQPLPESKRPRQDGPGGA